MRRLCARSQLRSLLQPWTARLLASSAPAGLRLGVGEASVSLFAAQPPSARRLCGGALALHRDYSLEQKPRDRHAFNLILLLEDVGERDGPTYVFEGSRGENVDKKVAMRDLCARGYRPRKLVGRRGDVFVFHAADWHGVEAIGLPPRGMPPPQSAQLRANLVLGVWHSCFDNARRRRRW